MIVLLDSGIWISALQFGGTPLKALEKALVEDEIAICDQIEEEIAYSRRNLDGRNAMSCRV